MGVSNGILLYKVNVYNFNFSAGDGRKRERGGGKKVVKRSGKQNKWKNFIDRDSIDGSKVKARSNLTRINVRSEKLLVSCFYIALKDEAGKRQSYQMKSTRQVVEERKCM